MDDDALAATGTTPQHPEMPEWEIERWFNTDGPLTVADLRGRVVLVHAFQMLCPGCVIHGVPQTQRVHRGLPADRVAVVGLHTVFEHHEVMSPAALETFIHEFRIEFPVGVDAPSGDGSEPRTMRTLGLRGTPTTLLLDRDGRIRLHHFGQIDDLALGALIGQLISGA